MTENEKKFIRTVVDYDANVHSMQAEIKEDFNVDSEFDEDTLTLRLHSDNPKNVIAAKAYITENYGEEYNVI